MNHAEKIINQILIIAFETEATDIHFYVDEANVKVFYRINGKRILKKALNFKEYTIILLHLKFSASMDIGESFRPQDGALDYESNGDKYSLRLSTLPVKYSESLTIRILPQTRRYPLDKLCLFPFQNKDILKLLDLTSGLVIFSGSTGSGKTTLMYSLIEELLKLRSAQIITLEDPIERSLTDVIQIQINKAAQITYENGLKAILRHDPDVILLGEIRDALTAEYAFRAALTGHLVLTTIHASSAQGTLERLKEMGISDLEINQTVKSVVSLELILLKEINHLKRRAAIAEIIRPTKMNQTRFLSFKALRKRAQLYGFLSEEEKIYKKA